ncbi:kelch-like protein 18 [Panonychus citri]|uniref:kelch-like protein 18 n=1 Tax=Panonychus citri TaxID=50023 RepID=UPI00230743EA|nr:kelch-like protein 18 [Panonychus citri]
MISSVEMKVKSEGSITLQKILTEKKFTDLMINLGDKQLIGHRCIILTVMPILNQLISSDDQINLVDQFDSNLFEMTFNHFYGHPLDLNRQSISKLLEIGKFIQSTEIISQCENYLIENLFFPSNNLFQDQQLAGKFNLKRLEEKLIQSMCSNYGKIIRESDFFELSVDQLGRLISRDDLIIDCEHSIFVSIVNWVSHDSNNRKSHLFDLLSNLRFHLIANNEITDHMLTNQLIRNCDQSISSVTISESICKTSDQFWLNNPSWSITIFGGKGPVNPAYSYRLNLSTNCWNKLSFKTLGSMNSAVFIPPHDYYYFQCDSNGNDQLTEKFYHHNLSNGLKISLDPTNWEKYGQSLVNRDDYLYVLGGKNWLGLFDKLVLSFNLTSTTWISFKSMNSKRAFLSTVNLKGRLFALGGQTEAGSVLNSVEVNDSIQSGWNFVSPMRSKRYGHSAIVYKENIYVVGGFDGQFILDSVEVYDSKLDKWSFLEPMKCSRYQPFLSVVGNKLYVIGGTIEMTETIIARTNFFSPNVEIYDFDTNSWSIGPSLPDVRSNGFAVNGSIK